MKSIFILTLLIAALVLLNGSKAEEVMEKGVDENVDHGNEDHLKKCTAATNGMNGKNSQNTKNGKNGKSGANGKNGKAKINARHFNTQSRQIVLPVIALGTGTDAAPVEIQVDCLTGYTPVGATLHTKNNADPEGADVVAIYAANTELTETSIICHFPLVDGGSVDRDGYEMTFICNAHCAASKV